MICGVASQKNDPGDHFSEATRVRPDRVGALGCFEVKTVCETVFKMHVICDGAISLKTNHLTKSTYGAKIVARDKM